MLRAQPHYAASKAAMIGLTNSYAHRLVKKGITSNAVSPGMCDSDMLQDMMKVVGRDKVVGMTGPGRLGTADEVAAVVVMLARNGYVNGQVIGVDGGIHKKVSPTLPHPHALTTHQLLRCTCRRYHFPHGC